MVVLVWAMGVVGIGVNADSLTLDGAIALGGKETAAQTYLAGSHVFVYYPGGNLEGYREENGKPVRAWSWKGLPTYDVRYGTGPLNMAVAGSGRTARLVMSDGSGRVLGTDGGASPVVWHAVPWKGPEEAHPLVAAGEGMVVAAWPSLGIVAGCINGKKAPRWIRDLVCTDVSVAGGYVTVVTQASLIVLQGATGETVWSRAVQGHPYALSACGMRVCVAGREGHVLLLEFPGDGRAVGRDATIVKWEKDFHEWAELSPPVLTATHVLFASFGSPRLICVRAEDGGRSWEHQRPEVFRWSRPAADGSIVCATGDRTAFMIDEQDGALVGQAVWSHGRMDGEPLSPALREGRVALAWMGSLEVMALTHFDIQRRHK